MHGIENIYQHFLSSTGITTDSRNIVSGGMFFALKGERFDGNTYAGKALEMGASCAVIDDPEYFSGSGCILVEDVLFSLQELARHHRQQLSIPLIGLTGTNGKTTTKELIARVLSKKFRTHATIGNLNNHIGVPLTILGIRENTEIAVIEMGANHPAEIAHLCSISMPVYGLITNIGKAHLEGFGSFEGVIRAKSELYEYLDKTGGTAIVNSDNELLMGLSKHLNRLTYGSDRSAGTRAEIINSLPFLVINWKGTQIDTQLYGDYNFENIMAAICLGEIFGVTDEDIAEAITSYIPSNSRSQLLATASNRIFLDAYNANPSSMLASVNNFERQPGKGKVLILGDMLELGSAAYEEHVKILRTIGSKFETVLLVGPEFMKASTGLPYHVFNNTAEASDWLKDNPIEGKDILVKGSRGIALENLIDLL